MPSNSHRWCGRCLRTSGRGRTASSRIKERRTASSMSSQTLGRTPSSSPPPSPLGQRLMDDAMPTQQFGLGFEAEVPRGHESLSGWGRPPRSDAATCAPRVSGGITGTLSGFIYQQIGRRQSCDDVRYTAVYAASSLLSVFWLRYSSGGAHTPASWSYVSHRSNGMTQIGMRRSRTRGSTSQSVLTSPDERG